MNNTASSNIELGGDLIRPTNVKLLNSATSAKYDLVFNGEGQFGVGNNLSAGSLYNYGSANSRAVFSHNNTALSTSFNPIYNTLASYYKSTANMSADVTGIISDVNANCTSYNLTGILSNVLGDAASITGLKIMTRGRTIGTSNVGYGIVATSSGALSNYGGVFTGHSQPRLGNFAAAYGVRCYAIGAIDNYGGFFTADSAAQNRGILSEARNTYNVSSSNCGMYGLADGTGVSGNSYLNIGVKGVGDFAQTSFGVAGYLSDNNSAGFHTPAVNAAIYGNSRYASGYSRPYAGFFDGDVRITGAGIIPSVWTSSDRSLKKEIKPITNAKDIIMKLQPKSFFYNTQNDYGLTFSDKKSYGIIAQELEEVLPELVMNVTNPATKDKTGNIISPEKTFKVVNYISFIGILLANAQDQQKQIDEQKQMIEDLQKKSVTVTGTDQISPDITGFSMNQNEPNPFTHETVIKYTLSNQTKTATLNVYDLSGKQITSFPLTEKGSSSITITSEKLAAGIYIYSIVADGKIMDSKRMVVAEK